MTCYRCTAPNASRVLVQHNGVDTAAGALCADCYADRIAEAQTLRDEFETLIEAGVSRAEANRMMIAKIDGKGPRA